MAEELTLVTGGTGFLGSAITKRLVKEGRRVRILDNNWRGSLGRLKGISDKIEYVNADVRNAEAVRKACEGAQRVVHLAYIQGTRNFYEYPTLVLDVAVKGITNVIEGCIKEKVKELVFASSSEVYSNPAKIPTDETAALLVPDPLNPRYSYSAGKIISEIMTINFGRKHFDRALIFRPHNVYGPDMGTEHVIPELILRIKEICQQTKDETISVPIQGTGKETRSFQFIDDFTEGLMVVLERGKHLETYNIGSGKEITINELAGKIGDQFGRKVITVPGELEKGSPARRCPDIKKLENLGYMQRTSLEEGLKETVRWYQNLPFA
jgi:nucleoside-diphosphate-sugar epimerase